MTVEISVPLLLILFIGLPHGALDILLIYRLYQRVSSEIIWALFGYLGITIISLVIWLWVPYWAFISFLIISSIHFGLRDTSYMGESVSRNLPVIIYGSTTIILVPLFHAEEVTKIFEIFVGMNALKLTRMLCWIAPLWVMGVIWLSLKKDEYRKKVLWEFSLITAMLAILPPLWGFAIYFCFVHALRHLSDARSVLGPFHLLMKFSSFLVAGLSIAAILGAAFATTQLRFDDAFVKATFIGLAALTIPHMLLIDGYGVLKRLSNTSNIIQERKI